MEIYENDFLKLSYNKDDTNIKNIIEIINERIEEIAIFFRVSKIENKIKIKVYYSQKEFKEYLVPFLDAGQYKDWMCASTHDGNINILSLENCHKIEEHSNMTEKEYTDIIIHEFVHKFHQIVKGDNETKNAWFHEALATNLSKQDYSIILITCTLDELKKNYDSVPNQYDISYTIGKYLLENYPHEFILSICKDEQILERYASKIFEEAKAYSLEHTTKRSKR